MNSVEATECMSCFFFFSCVSSCHSCPEQLWVSLFRHRCQRTRPTFDGIQCKVSQCLHRVLVQHGRHVRTDLFGLCELQRQGRTPFTKEMHTLLPYFLHPGVARMRTNRGRRLTPCNSSVLRSTCTCRCAQTATTFAETLFFSLLHNG